MLLSVPTPRATTNPYVVMLADALRGTSGVEVVDFDWHYALTGDYDVFHVHWPESLVRGRGTTRTVARHAMTAALLARLRATGTPLVRTLHNVAPHEQRSSATRGLLREVDRLTSATVSLNAMTPPLPGVPNEVILHGHYRPWFGHIAGVAAEPGRVISFGAIRPYKNLPSLLSVFAAMPDPHLRLSVAGPCPQPDLADHLRTMARADTRVELRLGHQPDADLVTMVTRSELVVLPYRDLHNSGAVLAALSLRRPVLVPSNDVTEALAEEVGPYWVRRYRGDLTGARVREALLGPPPREASPDLQLRNWDDAGVRHREVYRAALAMGRS